MSNVLNKSDFYYGAFLTKVLDQGKKPALVSRGGGRCIYKVTTDKKEYTVYIKYATNRRKTHKRWTYYYTENNIEEIRKYIENDQEIIFAYICSYTDLNDSEIAISTLRELEACIDFEYDEDETNRVIIHKKRYSPSLRMYGSKRPEMKDGLDNTIELDRNRINEL